MTSGTEPAVKLSGNFSNAPERDRRGYLGFAVVAAAALYLPYFVPQHAVASDSYLFGFNNRAAVVLLVLGSAAVAVWTQGCRLTLLPAGEPQKISSRTLVTCLLIQLLMCVGMALITKPFGGFRESVYELDRIWLVAHGKTPYVDLEWPFGVLLLYGPLWIARGLRLSLAGGYYVFWTAASLAGVALLASLINRLNYPSPKKNSIFVLLFAAFLPSTLGIGTHYTLLRYVPPLYCMLLVYEVSTVKRGAYGVKSAVLAVCCAAALLLLSPEMAVAFCFGCVLLLIPYESPRYAGAIGFSAYAAMAAAFALLFAAALKLHVLDTLLASGGGADSLPIPLSAPSLFFFGVVLLCACALLRRWQNPLLNDNSIVLLVVPAPLLMAALGRCDPGHMAANGLGLVLAVALYASTTTKNWWRFRNTYVGAMMVMPGFLFVGVVIPQIALTAKRAAKEWRQPVVPKRIDFGRIYPGSGAGAVFEAPFGYKPDGLGSYLSNEIDIGFYDGIENANTPQAIERKVDELEMNPGRRLLLPDHFEDSCRVDAHLKRLTITALFGFPYGARVAHPLSVHKPLCDAILAHYRLSKAPSEVNFGYGLWSPEGR